ncbi:uncharacterized protein [Neodiprion pinetum]|uniref:uncharacterized protein n=1 Tax=Neodiprion pinetum TaxID=441929 RepID=UPI00371E4FB1
MIKEYYESLIGGHQGVTKILNKIREKYFWPNMKKQIQNIIRSCGSYQRKKLVRIKTKLPMAITDTPAEAFDKVALDLIGPLSVTKSNNRYLLTIQCNLTKFLDAISIPDATAKTIGTHLHSGPKVVEIATFLAVIIFNEGFEAILKTLETMGVKIGPQAKGYVQQRDSSRIDRSERRTSDVVEQARIAKREDRAALRDLQEEEEGLLYGPDKQNSRNLGYRQAPLLLDVFLSATIAAILLYILTLKNL